MPSQNHKNKYSNKGFRVKNSSNPVSIMISLRMFLILDVPHVNLVMNLKLSSIFLHYSEHFFVIKLDYDKRHVLDSDI